MSGALPRSCAPRARPAGASGSRPAIRHGSVFDTPPHSFDSRSTYSHGGVADDAAPRTCVALVVSLLPSSSTYVNYEACGMPAVVPLRYGSVVRGASSPAGAGDDAATGNGGGDADSGTGDGPSRPVAGCALPPELARVRAAQAKAKAKATASHGNGVPLPPSAASSHNGNGADQPTGSDGEVAATCGELRRAVHLRLEQLWRGQRHRMPVRHTRTRTRTHTHAHSAIVAVLSCRVLTPVRACVCVCVCGFCSGSHTRC